MSRVNILLLLVFFISGLCSPSRVSAQMAGAAYHVVVTNISDFLDGSVVSFENDSYVLSKNGNNSVAGIVNLTPGIEINDFPGQVTVPLVKSGFTLIRVSTLKGNINPGDLLTLSDTPGVVVKAEVASEFIVGQAMANYESDQEGTILADIFIQKRSPLYARTGLKLSDAARESFFDMFAVLQTASQVPANQAFRYVLAGLILLVALLLSLLTFARSAQKGLEAIGRNPLAKYTIMMGVGLNVFFSVVVVFCAVVAAYFVIKL